MNNIIHETRNFTQQTDMLEALYQLGKFDQTARVTVKADKSYANQCQAYVELWLPTGWVRIANLYPDDWNPRDIPGCVELLLAAVENFLVHTI